MNTQFFLATTRLLIEPLTANDGEFIFELLNTEGWIKYIGNRNMASVEKANHYIQNILANKRVCYWVVKLKDDTNQLGIVTFIQRDYLEHPDIGFAFLPQFCNQGYAYEAASAVLQKWVYKQTFTHVLAITLPENISSIQLLKKLGLVFEKEMETENEKLHVYGVSADKLMI